MKVVPRKNLAISLFQSATSPSPSSMMGRSLALLCRSFMSWCMREMQATRSTMRSSSDCSLSVPSEWRGVSKQAHQQKLLSNEMTHEWYHRSPCRE